MSDHHDSHSAHESHTPPHESETQAAHTHKTSGLSKNKLLLLVGVAVVLMGVSGYGLFRNMQPQKSGDEVVITLTEDGFKPEKITIAQGTTVKFTSTQKEYYWPASDLHPSHGIYPAFDPKEPIAGDKSWSFRFDKPGVWNFHDHIAPYYTGTITVTEAK